MLTIENTDLKNNTHDQTFVFNQIKILNALHIDEIYIIFALSFF